MSEIMISPTRPALNLINIMFVFRFSALVVSTIMLRGRVRRRMPIGKIGHSALS